MPGILIGDYPRKLHSMSVTRKDTRRPGLAPLLAVLAAGVGCAGLQGEGVYWSEIGLSYEATSYHNAEPSGRKASSIAGVVAFGGIPAAEHPLEEAMFLERIPVLRVGLLDLDSSTSKRGMLGKECPCRRAHGMRVQSRTVPVPSLFGADAMAEASGGG